MAKRVPSPHTVPVALAIVDAPTLEIRWANEYLYAMAERFTDQEITGHPIGEFLPIDRVPEIELAIVNCADTGEPSFLEGEIVGPAGVMPMASSIYRIPGGQLLITAWHPVAEPIGTSTEPIGTMHAQVVVSEGEDAE